jgi:hypothetical protein
MSGSWVSVLLRQVVNEPRRSVNVTSRKLLQIASDAGRRQVGWQAGAAKICGMRRNALRAIKIPEFW